MPRNAIKRWRAELKRWLRDQGVSIENVTTTQSQTDSCSPEAKLEWAFSFDSLQPGQRQEFLRLRNRAWHRLLDECYGKCLLRQAKFAKIVARAILHYDRQKCDVDRLIVMPNHVHVIAQFRANTSLKIVSQSWMRYSAREINKELGTSGAFWQPEPFDHIIRNLKQFEYLQHYVADNARKAGLRDGEFLYWQQNNSSSPSVG